MSIKYRYKLRIVLTIFIAILLASCANTKTHFFSHNGDRLAGHYLPPTGSNPSPKSVLLFVHGDGAMPYDAHGYYTILWDQLRAYGFSIFSWDKPGIGQSTGNWLNQTMEERQSEVESAINYVQKNFGFNSTNTGLIGFSQAGWVVPAIATQAHKIGFAIGIGFATNWVDQGEYYTIRKSELQGKSESQAAVIAKHKREIAFLNTNPNYDDYLDYEKNNSKSTPMNRSRFRFVMNNYKSDASKDYHKVNIPTLLLWGSNDENVNASHEYRLRKSNPNPYITTRIISNATHALLNSSIYTGQNFDFYSWLKLMGQGKDAFSKGSLEYLTYWLNTVTAQTKH